jgi:DNA-binding NtrC family response regulator
LSTIADSTLSSSGDDASGLRRPTTVLQIMLECDRPAAAPTRVALTDTLPVLIGRGAARTVLQIPGPALRVEIPDARMSTIHARLRYELGHFLIEDAGSKNGVLVRGQKTQRALLVPGEPFEIGHTLFMLQESATVDDPPLGATGLQTFCDRLAAQFRRLQQVTPTNIEILIHGESGTGKELVARAVHQQSGRTGAFVAINCGAIAETIAHTELFGYRKGAFSGANEDRLGLVRMADKGTFFMDEIGDLPPALQTTLLRVLEEGEVLPVGATTPTRVDVRWVMASHRNLEAMVAEGKFREDLFARLQGFMLRLPPLRERREDLGILIAHMLGEACAAAGKPVPAIRRAAMRALLRYSWPRNIRELEKCLRTAVALAENGPIDLAHLPDRVRATTPAEPTDTADDEPTDAAQRDELLRLLREQGGNIAAVARTLGKDRKQIHRWVERYRIDLKRLRFERDSE